MTPLARARIVDLSRYAPGPYASLVCASLGAEIIKVEAPPDGDPLRQLDPVAFARLNQGKKSVVLDLKSDAGAAHVRRLVETSQVVIESFRPGVMARLGLDYPSLSSSFPRIVYVSISGYGQSGPSSARAGHDVNYLASAGALDGLSRPLAVPFADFAAGGLYAVIAILAAMMEGAGRHIDLSMHDGVLSLTPLADSAVADALSGRYPNYSVYGTQDGGALSVGALEPKFWDAFCEAVERPDWMGRSTEKELRDDVATLIKTRTRAEWEAVFADVDACVEVVATPAEAFAHPRATHRGRTPDRFQLPFATPPRALDDAPSLGEHTDEILAALG